MKGIVYSKPATFIKQWVGKLILTNFTGSVIRKVLKNKIPYRNSIIHTDYPEIESSVVAALYLGSYESGEARFINQYMVSDLPVVELGSSIGVVSTQIGKKTGQKIHLLEVNSDLIPIIETNLSTNNISNYTLVNAAISYDDQDIYFVKGTTNTTGRVTTDQQQGAIKMDKITLGQLLEQSKIKDKYVLVCDIEGMEIELIECDKSALQQCKQLIIELHDTQFNGHSVSREQLKNKLLDQGFTIKDSHGSNYVFERN